MSEKGVGSISHKYSFINFNSILVKSSSNNTSNDIKPEKKDYKHYRCIHLRIQINCENNIGRSSSSQIVKPYYKEFIDIRDAYGYAACLLNACNTQSLKWTAKVKSWVLISAVFCPYDTYKICVMTVI
ncbi:hypothetical protein ACTFIW_003023 [Dictyostelium discoideum]